MALFCSLSDFTQDFNELKFDRTYSAGKSVPSIFVRPTPYYGSNSVAR